MPVNNRVLRRATGLLAMVLAVGLGPVACGKAIHRYDRTTVLAGIDDPTLGLVLGSFPIKKVIDGDTITVDGLGASLRFLGLDTEETFKKKSEWRDFDKGWERYLADAQALTSSPVKIPTPLGEDAKVYADQFFKGVREVILERDHPKEIRDFYDRYLTYVFVVKDGKRINYNIECVRAGMSPYFTKYGLSRRFHDEFVAAQNEARAAQRGIWDPALQHYRDYDRRLEWWDRRGEFVQAFERDAEGRNNWIVLTHWDAMDRLHALLGREVVIMGAVGDIRRSTTGGPTKVNLSRRRTASLPLIFFDNKVLEESGILAAKGEYVRARGVVASYRNKYTGREDLQIVVTLPAQIESTSAAPSGTTVAPTMPPAGVEPPTTEPATTDTLPVPSEPTFPEPNFPEPNFPEPSSPGPQDPQEPRLADSP